MDDLLRERGYRLDFPLELVKYGQYSPRSTEKSRSAPHPLATAPILGQPPRGRGRVGTPEVTFIVRKALPGTVAGEGFWACTAPRKMADGSWIMAGMSVDGGYGGSDPAAVAISRGGDLTKWDVVRIPLQPGLGHVWGESTVIVDGKEVLNFSSNDYLDLARHRHVMDCSREALDQYGIGSTASRLVSPGFGS